LFYILKGDLTTIHLRHISCTVKSYSCDHRFRA